MSYRSSAFTSKFDSWENENHCVMLWQGWGAGKKECESGPWGNCWTPPLHSNKKIVFKTNQPTSPHHPILSHFPESHIPTDKLLTH